METTVIVKIQVKSDTTANWTANDPVLRVGEFGLDKDTNTLKIGDGVKKWSALPAIGNSSGTGTSTGGIDMSVLQPLLDAKVDKETGKALLSDAVKQRFEEAYTEKHQHDNSDVLAALTDVDGVLQYNGADIAASSALTPAQVQSLTNADAHAAATNNPHSTKIDNLADVKVVAKADGQVLSWSDAEQKYVLGTFGVRVSDGGTWEINGADTGIPVTDSTGRIRLKVGNALSYLSDVLDASLGIINDKLAVVTLSGLKTPIAQLNFIQGLDRNIMDYMAAIKGGMAFKTILENDAALDAVVDPVAGDTYIVRTSEKSGGVQVTYVYDGDLQQFLSMGETGLEIRDFAADPIDLTSEVTGVLPAAQVEGSHTHTNLADVLEELTVAGDELLFKGKSLKGETGAAGQDATANYNQLENRPQINGQLIVGNKTFKQYGAYLELLSREDFESEDNPGNVKMADKAKEVDVFVNGDVRVQPYMYYGTNQKNELGAHVLPINANNKSAIQQRIFEGVTAGDVLSFDSLVGIDNKAFIQCYTEVKGQEGVEETIKEFNINTQQAFVCSPEILFTETSCGLTGSKIIKPTYNAVDQVYEYDLSDFTTITGATELV